MTRFRVRRKVAGAPATFHLVMMQDGTYVSSYSARNGSMHDETDGAGNAYALIPALTYWRGRYSIRSAQSESFDSRISSIRSLACRP